MQIKIQKINRFYKQQVFRQSIANYELNIYNNISFLFGYYLAAKWWCWFLEYKSS